MPKEGKSELLQRYEDMTQQGNLSYFDVDQFDEIAFLYEVKENYKEALQVVKNGLKQHPGNTDLLIKEAKYLLYLDNIEDAETKLSALPYEDEEVIMLKAELCLIKKEYVQAMQLLNSLLDNDNISSDLCLDVMSLLMDFDRMDEVIHFVDCAIKLLPDTTLVLRELASLYEEKEQFDLALDIYDQLLDKDPYSNSDWLNLAKIYAIKKDYEKSIEACDFALAIDETDINALSFKGYCLYDSKRYKEAIEIFKEYAVSEGNKSVAYELIAECYSVLKKPEEAIIYLLKALETNPEDVEICYQLATNYYEAGDINMAIEFLKKAIAIDDKDSTLFSFLGEIYLKQKNFKPAEDLLKKAVVLDAENEDAYMLLGDLKSMEDMPEEAIPFYQKVLDITPYNIKATLKLILAEYNSGNQVKAASLIKYLDDVILQEENTSKIPDDEKENIMQAKSMLDTLRDILRNNLGEKI